MKSKKKRKKNIFDETSRTFENLNVKRRYLNTCVFLKYKLIGNTTHKSQNNDYRKNFILLYFAS